MSYAEFRLPDVIERFGLTTREGGGLFADRPPVDPSPHLAGSLRGQVDLAVAIGNEKARSEFIVAPILFELKRSRDEISLFSGVDLPVDPSVGLTGTCDFLLSLSPEQTYVKAPIVTLVEAKKMDFSLGWGQCAAEMVGAQRFNEKAKNPIETVYGAVTTGTGWMFMSLSDSTLSIDFTEYSIQDLPKILGILSSMLAPQGKGQG